MTDTDLPPVPQRTHPRRKVMLRGLTQADVSASERLGVVRDLSLSGAFIETHTRPARGTRLWLSLKLDDGNQLHSYVEVVRVTASGIGARFVRLDPDALAMLDTATTQHP